MPDLATLGLAIDSSQAVSAAEALDKMADSGAKAEVSASGVENAAKAVNDAMRSGSATVSNFNRNVGEMAAAASSAAFAQAKVTKAIEDSTKAANDNLVIQNRINDALGIGRSALKDRAADFEAAAAAGDRLRSKYDPLFAASQRLASALAEINYAEKAGIVTSDIATAAREKESRSYDSVASAADRAAAKMTLLNRAYSAQIANNYQTGINKGFGIGSVQPGRQEDFEAAVRAADELRAKYEPLFAASQRLASATAEINEAERAGVLSANAASAARADQARSYNEIASAASRSAQTAKMFAQASVNKQSIFPDRAADIEAYGKELDSLREKYNPVFAAEQRLKATLEDITRAKNVGALNSDEADAAIKAAQKAAESSGSHGHGHGGGGIGDMFGVTNIQVMEATHVFRSFFEMLAAGQSPMRAFMLEAGRIQTFFQIGSAAGKGGVSDQLSGIGSGFAMAATKAAGLITPLTAAVAGITALGVAAVAAFASFESGQDKAVRSLNGLGQRTGNTLADLNRMAAQGAARGGLSTSEGLGLASGFAGVGIGGAVNQALIGDTKGFSRLTGGSLGDAGDELAKLFKDPIRGAEDLDDRFGILDGRLKQTIEDLVAQGSVDQARAELETRLHDALAQTVDTTWTFTKALSGAANVLSDLWHKFGSGVASTLGLDSDASKLANLQAAQANLRSVDPLGNADAIAAMQQQIDALQARVDQEQKRADQNKADADSRAQSERADAVVKAVLPEIVRQQTTSNQLAVLRFALSDSNVLDRMGAKPGEVQRAYGNLAVQAANDNPVLRQKQDYDLALASADAFTLAERAAVEARRAELQVLRETGDLTRAHAASQEAVNLAIAKSNSDAKDSLELAKQSASYVGMTSYQRGRQQIVDKFEGYGGLLSKDDASKSALSDAMKPVASDLKTAGDQLADAIREAAEKVKGAVSGGWGSQLPGSSPILPAGGLTASADAIKAIESSGNYGALGPITKGGDRAYGAYQVMGANIPAWSRSALGYSLTPTQFMADPAAQDAVFNRQFGASMAKYGNASDAASVWFTGKPLAQGANARDITGTSGSQYVDRFNARLGNPAALTVGARYSGPAPIASTASADHKAQEGVELNAYDKAAQIGPTTAAAQQIKELDAALKSQQATYGETAEKIARAAFEQNLYTQYQREGVTPTAETKKQIEALGDQFEDVTKRTRDFENAQKRIGDALDGVRSASESTFSTVFSDLANGKKGGEVFRDVIKSLQSDIISLASHSITNALFGGMGQSGGGAFGGGLSSMFSGWFGGGSSKGLFGSLFGSASGGGGSTGVGHNASGSEDWSGGPTWVGERGPEIVDVPRGAQIVPNSALGGGDGSIDVHYHDMVGTQPTVTQSRGPDGKRQIQVMVEQAVARSANTNGPGFRALAARAGTGRTGGA